MMRNFDESAARFERSDGSVAGFVGGATVFYERCEDYGGYGNSEISRNEANKTMQRDPLVTHNDKAMAERFDSVATQIATIGTEAKLEDSSPVMGIVEVPVFPYVVLRQWISWMEHYFARKGLNEFEKLHMADGFIEGEPAKYLASIEKYFPIRSWEELKTKLIWEFGADDDQEKIIMKARRARSHEAFLTWEAEKRRDSSLCSKLVKTKITSPLVAEVNEEELEIQNDSLPDREQEDDVQCEISVSSCGEQSELTSSTVEDVNVTFGGCIEIELLKKTANEEDVSADLETGLGCAPAAMESMQSADSDSVMEDELQITKPSDTEVTEEKSVEVITELSQNLTEISHPAMVETGCVYSDGLSFVLQPHSFAAEQTSVKYMLWLESIEEGCRVLNGFRMRFEKLLFNVYLSFWEVDRVEGEFHLKHKWRSKQLNQASFWQLVLEQAVCGRTELLYGQKFIEFGTGLTRIRGQIWNQFDAVPGSRRSLEYQLRWRLHKGLRRYMRNDQSSIWHRWRYKTLGSAAVFHNGAVSERSNLVHESTVLDHQVWHRWRFKKSEALEVWFPELLSQNVPSLLLVILHVLSLVPVAERLGFGLLQSGSCRENDSLIMLSSSLWSSLISREGVYMIVHACLLVVNVMIWWFTLTSKSDPFKKRVREQREKTKPCIQEMVQVENQQSLIVNDSIEIHVKRQQGQVLIHQQKRWKKFFKSWMFKYKEKEKTSAATLAMCRNYKTFESAVLISFIMIFSLDTRSLFSFSKLVGKLVFYGGSIDRLLLSETDVAG